MRIKSVFLTLAAANLLLATSRSPASDGITLQNVPYEGAPVTSQRPPAPRPMYARPFSDEEPLRQEYSLKAAAQYLDRAASAWRKEKNCFACHTDYVYLMARPAIPRGLATHKTIRAALEERVKSPRVKKPNAYQSSEAVMVATVLASNDAATTGSLHPLTRKALDRMWTLQREDGGWTWQKGNKPPSGIDDYFGVAMAAIGAGAAPDDYNQTPAAREGIDKIREYFRINRPANMHNRAMLLWASTYIEGLVTKPERHQTIENLFALQKSDGGWGLATLGRNWKRSDDQEQDYESSDGYGTGFVIYILRRAGVPADDARIRKGIAWLKANQRAGGRWFTRSAHKHSNYITNAGTAFALLALAECGETDALR